MHSQTGRHQHLWSEGGRETKNWQINHESQAPRPTRVGGDVDVEAHQARSELEL